MQTITDVTDVTDFEQAIVEVVRALPPERAREVLDFALFLQSLVAAADSAWDDTFATRADDVAAWVDRMTAEGGEPTGIDASGETLKPAPQSS